jgi:hypothetical protein
LSRNRETPPSILDLKSKLLLIILGSFDNGAIIKLRSLKECLIQKGYSKCKLVSDYKYPIKRRNETVDEYNLRKSIWWLAKADACIFVFLYGFKNDGVIVEFKHTCDHLVNQLESSLLAIENKAWKSTTSLIRGTAANQIKFGRLNQRFFRNEQQLCILSSKAAISFLKYLRFYLLDKA